MRDAPQVPTIAETYPGFNADSFSFITAPAGIPEPILQKLSDDLRAVVQSTEFGAKMLSLGAEARAASAQQMAVLIPAEIAKWAAVAKAAGIKAD